MPLGPKLSRLGAALACTLLVSLAATAAPAGAGPGPLNCPPPKPVRELAPGMVGTGWTVSRGDDPEPFNAEILGVLEDGIAPGRDMIVVETSSPAIEAAGGVWQGMSGSPVYVDNELIGAVSHALSSGPSHVAGLTVAKDLFNLLGYPVQEGEAAAAAPTASTASASIRTSSGAQVGDADGYRRLRLPLHASGLTARGMRRLSSTLGREHAPLTAYAGSSSSGALGAPLATLGAGDSFGAALSYGDVTFATIGTTALVCDEKAVAFGHQLKWAGSTEMGANAASAIGIVDNEEEGPYKLAKVGGLAGTVDQDRLAGLRALLSRIPEVVPVVSEVTAENTGVTQRGKSYAVLDRIVPSLAFYHFIGHVDATFDQITGGSSDVFFRIKGETDDGVPFEVERDNLYSTHEDISIASAHELERSLWTLLTQPFEEIDFTKVKVRATITEERTDLRIRKVRVSINGSRFKDNPPYKVEGGDDLDLRVRLRDAERNIIKVELHLDVPKGARGDGYIEVAGQRGGRDDGLSCFFDGEICKVRLPRSIDSFDEVVDFLETRPRNNVLTAALRIGRRTADRDSAEIAGRPVTGYDYVPLDLPGGHGDGGFIEGRRTR